jgi:rare lipoprotein A
MTVRANPLLSGVLLVATLGVAPSVGYAARVEAPDMGAAPHPWQQIGQASFYSNRYDGRRTSSGARYDPEKLTAAHPSLPLGTRLQVIDEASGRRVVVTVTDRQARNGRVIDLSRRAAEDLGIIGRGTARVRLVALTGDAPVTDAVQVASDDDTDWSPRPTHAERRRGGTHSRRATRPGVALHTVAAHRHVGRPGPSAAHVQTISHRSVRHLPPRQVL